MRAIRPRAATLAVDVWLRKAKRAHRYRDARCGTRNGVFATPEAQTRPRIRFSAAHSYCALNIHGYQIMNKLRFATAISSNYFNEFL
jgi:hypothetical protein